MATPAIWFPQTITAGTNDEIRVYADMGGGLTNYTDTIAPGTYYDLSDLMSGAGGIEDTINGLAGGAMDGAVTLSSDGRVSISIDAISASPSSTRLRFDTAARDGLGTALGFDVSSDMSPTSTSGTPGNYSAVFTAPYRMPGLWIPDGPFEFGTETPVTQAVTMVEAAGGQAKFVRWNTHVERPLRFTFLTAIQTWAASATGTDINRDLESYWTGEGLGRVEFYADASTILTDTPTDYYVSPESARRFDPERFSPGLARYAFEMLLRSYTA